MFKRLMVFMMALVLGNAYACVMPIDPKNTNQTVATAQHHHENDNVGGNLALIHSNCYCNNSVQQFCFQVRRSCGHMDFDRQEPLPETLPEVEPGL